MEMYELDFLSFLSKNAPTFLNGFLEDFVESMLSKLSWLEDITEGGLLPRKLILDIVVFNFENGLLFESSINIAELGPTKVGLEAESSSACVMAIS